MPTGLDAELTEQQLSDLIAYLRSLTGEAAQRYDAELKENSRPAWRAE